MFGILGADAWALWPWILGIALFVVFPIVLTANIISTIRKNRSFTSERNKK